MITKITALKNIRSFLDFSNPTEEFHKKNIIYAPNGTGKTNISRVFDKLSKNETLDELLSQEVSNIDELDFKIQLENNIEVTKSNLENHKNVFENIYVFNSDYIEETIKSKNFSEIDVSGEVKIPIGKESNKITELKKSIKKSKKDRADTKEVLEKVIDTFQNEKIISKSYTRQDINIWKELKIEKVLNDDFTITPPTKNDDFDDCESKFKEISKIDENTSIDSSKLKIVDYSTINFEEITRELETPKHFKIFDQAIKSSIEELTKNWIEETNLLQKGVELSKEKGSCILCNRALDSSVEDLFNKYQAYFANEEAKFKEKLTRYSNQIQSIKNQISNTNNNLESEVNNFARLFNIKKSWRKIQDEEIIEKLKELEDAIQNKRDDLGHSFSVYNDNNVKYNFNKGITILNDTIEDNQKLVSLLNSKFSKTKEEKTKLRTIIGQKFLYEFYQDNKVEFAKIDSANRSFETDREKLGVEQEKLPKTKVSSNIETLCKIFLRDYLYIDKYKVEEKDGVLTLKLSNYDISNATQKISEGEKTMISLVFFLASSIKKFDSSEKFFNAIFIIDDPINSTSYNYFFGICNLLKFFDETIVSRIWGNQMNKLSNSKLQKIILSHNSQFFNVIRENVFKGDNDKFFILTNNTLNFISRKRLKSDFENALTRIKKSIETQDYQTSVGNELRRFFETIKHFYGIKDFNADTLERIFNGFEVKKHHIFYTVINYYSHSNPEAHTDPLPIDFEPFLNEFEELIKESQFKELWNNIKVD
jgi:wobble nucleotide-excising tRNase